MAKIMDPPRPRPLPPAPTSSPSSIPLPSILTVSCKRAPDLAKCHPGAGSRPSAGPWRSGVWHLVEVGPVCPAAGHCTSPPAHMASPGEQEWPFPPPEVCLSCVLPMTHIPNYWPEVRMAWRVES